MHYETNKTIKTMWNELVNVIRFDKVEQEDKNHARLLLSLLNTASGSHLMKKEITNFLEDMVEKYGEIPTKATLEQQLIELKSEMENFKEYWANKPKLRDDIIMISNRMHQYTMDLKKLEDDIARYNKGV